MSRDLEALIAQIESDLVYVHRMRMADRKAVLFLELEAERAKPAPDAQRIEALQVSMLQAERAKLDVSITEREVLASLRDRLRERNRPSDSDQGEIPSSP